MALLYERGAGGLPQNNERARYWLSRAADQGDAWGAYDLGICYQVGRCAPQDYRQAYAWFAKAAAQNFGPAQCYIGFIHERGLGVPVDRQEALSWYLKAQSNGGCPGAQSPNTALFDSTLPAATHARY